MAIALFEFEFEMFCVTSENTNSEIPNPFGDIGITPTMFDKIEDMDITFSG